MSRMIVQARLTKLSTADGLVAMKEDADALVGKIYLVDLDTKRMATLHNIDRNVLHQKEIVSALNDDGSTGWMPLEMLELRVGTRHSS